MPMPLALLLGFLYGWALGPVWILLIWGATAFILGFLSKNNKAALKNGGVFGFVASFIFMLHGYTGTDPVISKVLFFILLGVFGGVCGLIAALVGYFLKSKIKKGK